MKQIFENIKEELKNHLNGKKVLLACSTGVDSMVLLDLLMNSLDKSNIVIAHVNHQKRKQSEYEEEFITKYAKENNVECYTLKLPKYTDNNFQSWARTMRYEFFYELKEKCKIDTLLLAHHAYDNLETILMRICRSSSIEGYAGMRKHSAYLDLDIYRPLLEVSKDDIIKYAKENNLTFFNDESNDTDDYTRNRIRHHVIPILIEENPSLTKAITNYSKTIFEASDFLENYETNFIKKIEMVHNNNDYFAKIPLQDFQELSPFFKEQILFRLLKPFSLSKECIKDTIKQLDSKKQNIVQKINNELFMIKEYGYVIFTTEDVTNYSFYLKLENETSIIIRENEKLEVCKNICNFITSNTKIWYNIKCMPIIIRTRQKGDKIKKQSGTISVSDYLTNKKVPYLQRQKTLLLCDGNNTPIAILGYVIK